MRIKLRKLSLLILVFLLGQTVVFASEKAGACGASFLEIEPGARPAALGGSFVGLAEGIDSLYFNPSGLARIDQSEIGLMWNRWLEDVGHGYLAYVGSLKEGGGFGVSLSYVDAGKIRRTTISDPYGIDSGDYGSKDLVFGLSYGQNILENISAGATLKYIREKIEDESRDGLGLDLGLLYKTPIRNLEAGLAVQNIGPELTEFVTKKDKLILNYKVGVGYKALNNRLILGLDINKPRGDDYRISLGSEYLLHPSFILRAGYKLDRDIGSGLSVGLGLKHKEYGLDYAYVPYGNLGDSHRLSFLLRLGREKGKEEEGKGERKEKEEARILALRVTDDGDYTRDKTRLYAFWDEVPRAKEYQYAIGTNPGGMDVVGWTSSELTPSPSPLPQGERIKKRGDKIKIDVTGLSLVDGKTYYVSVRAKKRRLLIFPYWQASGSSDGITVDSISPGEPVVTDDGVYTTDNKEFHATWNSTDQISGIKEYLYALGTTPNSADVLGWRSVGSNTELALTEINLNNGETCHLSVKAIDNAGNESEIGSSDGIMVDTTPPVLTAITDEGEYATDMTRLSFSFNFEDKESGIAEHQYAIGTSAGGDDVLSWKPTTETRITESNLNLTNGQTYYFTVKAKNKAGLWNRPESSDGIMVDITPPTTPVVTDDGDTTTDTTSLHFSWSSIDDESGIVEYQYAIGTTSTGADMVGWTTSKETEIEVADLSLLPDKTYYISVKARNKVGLWSEAGTSNGITIARVIEPELINGQLPITNYQSGKGDLKMAVQIYEDPDYVKLYVYLKNVGDEAIYPTLSNFTLLTENGQEIRPSISRTYTTEGHFSSGTLSPNSEAEGFLIFNAKDIPKTLTYKDLPGNEVSVNLP